MWIITPDGFYSAVRKPGTDHLTVRARSGPDLDRLRERWLPELGSNEFGTGTDYPVRATCSHREFADGLGRFVNGIDALLRHRSVSRDSGRSGGHPKRSLVTDPGLVRRRFGDDDGARFAKPPPSSAK